MPKCLIKILRLACLASLYLTACQTSGETLLYDPGKVPVYQCTQKDSLPIDGIGAMILIQSSKYLVTVHFQEDFFFQVYSKEDYTMLGSAIQKGRGPGELLQVGYINQWKEENGHLKVLTNQWAGAYAWVDIDLALTNSDSTIQYKRLKLEEKPDLKMIDVGTINCFSEDSLLLSIAPLWTENRPEYIIPYHIIYNQRTGKFSKPYPYSSIKGKNDPLFTSIYSNVGCPSPDNRYFAKAIRGLKTVQITDLHTHESKEIKFPDAPLHMETVSEEDVVFGFAAASPRFVWVSESKGLLEMDSHRIYLLDWQGQPCCTLVVDKNILTFIPDEKGKALYVVDRIEGIFRYDLSEFYDSILPQLQ